MICSPVGVAERSRQNEVMAPIPLHFAGTVINSQDPDAHASFYERLLGWPRLMDEPDWIALRRPEGGTAIAFQRDRAAIQPTWPSTPGGQQMLLHLDFTTDDLDGAVHHALESGASLAPHQPSKNERVLLDPAGLPFCLIASAT